MQAVIDLLLETNEKLSELSDKLSADIQNEDFWQVRRVYELTEQMNIYTSQIADIHKVYEGPCKVDNVRAMVVIDGFAIRGNIPFEMQINGEWKKGRRENSQYGQIFRAIDNSVTKIIVSGEDMGRVTLPLE